MGTKEQDRLIIRLNSLGLSLATIAEEVGRHPSTVLNRLQRLGIDAADTRRAFMEDIYNRLPAPQRDWLSEQVGPGHSIKDFVHNLITKAFVADTLKD